MSIDVTTLDVFPFPGVWAQPIKLSRQFITNVDLALTSDETRDAILDAPRLGIKFAIENLEEHAEARAIERFLRAHIGQRIVVPIWTEAIRITETPIGNLVACASTIGRLFSISRHAVLINVIGETQPFDIESVDEFQITATADIPDADVFEDGEIVVLVMITEPISAQSALSFESSYYATGGVEFWEDVGEASALPFDYNFPAFAGLSIFPMPFTWATQPSLAFSRTAVERRADTNVVETAGLQTTAATLLKGLIDLDGRDQIARVLAFFDAQLGRQQRFWAPSGKRDFKVIETANNSAQIAVENSGFTSGEWADNPKTARTFIVVRDVTNGAWYARRITAAAFIDSNTERLTLTSAIPHVDALSHISFLYLARFNLDDIEIDFDDTDHGSVSVEFMELPNETSDFIASNASAGTIDAEGVLLA